VAGPPDRLEVGRIARPHGIRGEVVVDAVTNRPERFATGSCLFAGDRTLEIVGGRPHQGRWLVHFAGIDDRTTAETLRGLVLTGEALGDLGPDEFWVHELIGARVTDRSGHAYGHIVAIEDNPAHDLLVLDGDRLVPSVFIVETRPGEVVIDPPAGLLE
jgi:16S rRNA processing protein RimM